MPLVVRLRLVAALAGWKIGMFFPFVAQRQSELLGIQELAAGMGRMA